jgi:seryl-tRNA(Sec) selenium transferase
MISMVKIPLRLDELLHTAAVEKLLDVLQQPDISGKVREALHKVGLQDAAPLEKVREAWQQARGWIDSVAENSLSTASFPRTLNATGQLFSANLAAVPWGAAAAFDFAKAASHYQSTAAIARQTDEATREQFAKYLSGHAHTTAWLASTSQALQLLVRSPAGKSGCLVSRADAVRIAGLGDIRSMLANAYHPVIEIGAANGVRPEDWKAAFSSPGGLVVLTSPNNLTMQEASQHRTAAIAAARGNGAKVIEVLADGVLSAKLMAEYAFPSVQHALQTGADVVVLPTHLLLGGPPGALLIGAAELIQPVHSQAENIGALLGGPQLLAAAAALRTAGRPESDVTAAAAQLLINPENLRNRARRLALQMTALGEVAEAHDVELTSSLGPSPWHRYQVTSWGIRLKPRGTLAELVKQISQGETRQGLKLEWISEPESLALNLRFIPPQHDHELVLVIVGDPQEIDHCTST